MASRALQDTLRNADMSMDVPNMIKGKVLGQQGSLYSFLQSIDGPDAVMYVGIGSVAALIVSRMRITGSALVGLGAGAILVYLIASRRQDKLRSRNEALLYRLQSLDYITKVTHPNLYLEPDIIDFFADNIDMRSLCGWTPSTGHWLLSDSFARLKRDVEIRTEMCQRDIDTADGLRRAVLNHVYEIDFNLPNSRAIQNKLYSAVSRLEDLLLDLMEEMQHQCSGEETQASGDTSPLGRCLHRWRAVLNLHREDVHRRLRGSRM